jgi:predicted DNA-binding transcriptional regulator YafY
MTLPRFQPKRFSVAAGDRGGGSNASAIARTQRAIRILRLLQAGQVWSAQELAIQFNCSTRTIFRDLQLLRDCGIPIDNPRGERGFKLAHDFFWQPERPTLDEMTALVVGARMAEDSLPGDMQKNLGSALTKLVGSERPAVRQRLAELNMRIDPPHAEATPALPALEFLPKLLEYIGVQTPVRIVVASESQDALAREFEWIPVRLHYGNGQWHLIGLSLDLAGPPSPDPPQEQSAPLLSIVQINPAAVEAAPATSPAAEAHGSLHGSATPVSSC